MSLAEIESKVLALSEDERRQFVNWFYDHEREIVGPAPASGQDEDGLSAEQVAELQRRLKEADEHPERLQPWDESLVRLRGKLNELRHQEHHAG